jgi:hypothetical protein
MGRVVNKSFKRVRKDIRKKADKLLHFLEHLDKMGSLQETEDWTAQQNSLYETLGDSCFDLMEEISNLDEIEVPDYKK